MIFQSPGAIELPIQVKSATKQETMLASFGHDGDGEVSVASDLRGLCVRDASDEDTSALVASAADAGGYGGLLDEEELAGQAEAAGEEDDDDERRWLREAFRMYEMEGAGCITPRAPGHRRVPGHRLPVRPGRRRRAQFRRVQGHDDRG